MRNSPQSNNIDEEIFKIFHKYISQNKVKIIDYSSKKELEVILDVVNKSNNKYELFIKNEDIDLINELKKYSNI